LFSTQETYFVRNKLEFERDSIESMELCVPVRLFMSHPLALSNGKQVKAQMGPNIITNSVR
jgi:hypothetical protein